MADYHSLLARAVANLPKPSTPAARQAIYDRARTALLNQLRSLKPQLPDSDIAREEAALNEAVTRLEAEIAPAPPSPPPPAKPITPPPRPPRPATTRAETTPPPKPPPAPPPVRAPTPAPARAQGALASAAVRAPAAPASSRMATAAPAQSRAPMATAAAAAAPQSAAAVAPAPRVSAIGAPAARKVVEEPPAVVVSDAAQVSQPDNAPKIGSPVETVEPSDAAARPGPEPARPIAPAPRTTPRASPWLWTGLAIAIGLIGSVAVAAFLLREKPQDLTIKDPAAIATPGAPADGEKIAERVDGAASPEPTPVASAPPTPTPVANPTPAASAVPAAPQAPTPVAESTPAAAATPPQPATQAPIPIAARAAMLVADGADTQKPAVSVGSVVWSPVAAIPGQPGSVGVKADIDIPDLRMHASMVLRKNVDPGLPASHTIDFRVSFDPGSPIKGVKDIALPLMRRDDPPAADALVGVRVKINDGYYLVGLNRADADVAHNVDEIGSRGWFDFPMQLSDDRIAKLTFEKAADGDRVVADAITAWK